MKHITIILAILILSIGAFAQETPAKHEIAAQGLVYNIDKAIVGANEVITQLNESAELSILLSDLEELRDSINVSGFDREQFESTREKARELVSQFRGIATTSLTNEERNELRETIKEKQQAVLKERREEFKELKRNYNNNQLERIQKSLQERLGENFTVPGLRERINTSNFTIADAKNITESIRGRAQTWQNMGSQERQEQTQQIRSRSQAIGDEMRNRTMRDAQMIREGNITQEEFLENQKEYRSEALEEVMGNDSLVREIAKETDKMQDQMLDQMDTDKDGEISEEEALAFKEKMMREMPTRTYER